MIDEPPTPEPSVATAALIAHARSVGFEVSDAQLKRWTRAGLLPRPMQVHVEGHRGSVTLWPTATISQLLTVCQLARTHRRLDTLLLAVWWDRGQVAADALLAELARRVDDHPVLSADRSATDEDRLDAVDAAVQTLDLARTNGPLGRAVRRSGRSEADRQSFLFGLAAIASGVAPELDSADLGFDEASLADLLARGLSLDHFARQLTEAGQAVTTAELVATTTDLARLLCSIANHAAGVISAGDINELAAARDQARVLGSLSELSAEILALDPTNGLGLVAGQLELDSPDGWIVTLVLVLWFRAVTPEAVEVVTRAIEQTLPKAKASRQLLDNVPGLRELCAAARGDFPLLAELGESHPEVRSSLQRYLRDHPELADQLDAS